MTDQKTGPVTAEITRRLTEALAPTRLEVRNQSEAHRGHAGYDGSGESHFMVQIVSPHFRGMSRLQRQRTVNDVLADLMHGKVHALSIRAEAPGEA